MTKNQKIWSQDRKSISQEAVLANELFQSISEELQSKKRENLKHPNEDLAALNRQLQEAREGHRHTAENYQNVLNCTNVGTLFLDLDLKIQFYSPAIKSCFAIIAGDVGRPLADLRPIVSDGNLLADARRALAAGSITEREVSAPDGVWFLRSIFPCRGRDNRIEGVVITFSDITERKLRIRTLEASKLEATSADLAKARLLAAASNDLRQQMQSLTLLQVLLAKSIELGEEPQTLLKRQESTLSDMSRMFDALLIINQIEAGRVEAKPVIFPIGDVLDQLRNEFTGLAQSRNVSLHILPSLAIVQGDPKLLKNMICKLLSNAIKYTRGGKILMGCRRRGDSMRIEVREGGIGIDMDEPHAVAELLQVDGLAYERNQSLRPGHSIVQRLGQLAGHDIEVRSLPGNGTTFAITVASPIERATRHIAPVPDAAAMVEAGRHRCKIVIVDDDPDVLGLLGRVLRDDGHIVRCASDSTSALKLIASGVIQPEILLIDDNLANGMNGLDPMAKHRDTLSFALPTIFLTSDAKSPSLATTDWKECIWLSKPVTHDEITAAIERLLPPGLPSVRPVIADLGQQVEAVTYLVADSFEVRATLRAVLEGAGRMVVEFDSAETFLDTYRPGAEGCLLIDAHLPGTNGIALLETLRVRGDHIPAILIAGGSDIGFAVDAMRTGACDFIKKPMSRQVLISSIGRAIDQSHEIRRMDAMHDDACSRIAGLTSRQREVMDMVLAGRPSKIIAAELGISQRTVEKHRAAIMHQMAVKSLPELAQVAAAAVSV